MRRRFLLIACLTVAACSDAERDAAADADGNGSLTANTAAVPDPDAPATIDCARASGQAEQAVCADKELAALDRLAGPGDDLLKAARNACVRADELRPCLVEAYAMRIAERAKAGSANRAAVTGPVAFACGPETIEATFINSEPGYVVIAGGDRPAVLPRVAAASGVAFEGRVDGEPWSLWNKGREATLIRSGREAACAEAASAG